MVTVQATNTGNLGLQDLQVSGPISLIDSYPFDQVKKKILMEGTIPEEQIDEAIHEFRNYMKLIALGHQNIAMTNPVVDEVWHTFILFTRDYAAFCHEVFGFFVHHVPNISGDPMKGAVEHFRNTYEAEFGSLPKIWLGTTDDQCHGTTNCQPTPDGGGCNSWGGSVD